MVYLPHHEPQRVGVMHLIVEKMLLNGCGGRRHNGRSHHMNLFLTFTAIHPLENNDAFDGCKQGVILAHTHIVAGVELGPTLTNKDVTGDDLLATKFLDAQTLGIAIAAILNRAAAFFMCHCRDSSIGNERLTGDAVHAQACDVMAMTALAAIHRAHMPLEDNDFFIAELVFNREGHGSTINSGRPDHSEIAIAQEQNVAGAKFSTNFMRQLIHINEHAFFGTILTSAKFYNCVHGVSPNFASIRKPKTVLNAGQLRGSGNKRLHTGVKREAIMPAGKRFVNPFVMVWREQLCKQIGGCCGVLHDIL